jgi:hypothetical protein
MMRRKEVAKRLGVRVAKMQEQSCIVDTAFERPTDNLSAQRRPMQRLLEAAALRSSARSPSKRPTSTKAVSRLRACHAHSKTLARLRAAIRLVGKAQDLAPLSSQEEMSMTLA